MFLITITTYTYASAASLNAKPNDTPMMVRRLIHHIISCFIGPLGQRPLDTLVLNYLYSNQRKKDAHVETEHPLVHL